MSKYFALICAMLIAAMATIVSAHAGEASHAAFFTPSSSAATLFQRVRSKPCCYNNGEYFNSTASTCQRYGGRVVPYEYCERQYRYGDDGYPDYSGKPCCFNSGQFFNATPKTCRRYGGRVVRQERCNSYYYDQYGDDDYAPNAEKPCCYNNGRYFNSTPKTCRKYGGQTVEMRYCLRRHR